MRWCGMGVRRTTINLDLELVMQAREVLKTKNTTDTVHSALREVVRRERLRRERLRRLAQRDWQWLTPERLKAMRQGAHPADL
jgi:Arc/MetJ family transcription regulator